uniref:Uncharacterized protein n=1 Tax=Klebsiella pneumoniae TaxID=573 RepID=A0A2R4ND96_KLEPN|nr:Hypothetical protein [Klebsiella pneumoniae]UVX22782.1 hypothetical protein [Escherichia coli]
MTTFLEEFDHFQLKHRNILLLKPQIMRKGIRRFLFFFVSTTPELSRRA